MANKLMNHKMDGVKSSQFISTIIKIAFSLDNQLLKGWAWWLIPEIPATWEAEIRRSWF
jgi:hypothetical protein